MGNADEFLRAASQVGAQCRRLEATEAAAYIAHVFEVFSPARTSGHVMVGHDSDDYPLERAEWDYSLGLPHMPARIFFDQSSSDRAQVLELNEGHRVCEIMRLCFGMEYFVSNIDADYLIAVNWYVVEVTGTARAWLRARYGD